MPVRVRLQAKRLPSCARVSRLSIRLRRRYPIGDDRVRRAARDRERAGEHLDETRTIFLDVTTASTTVAVKSKRNARCPSTTA